MSPAKIAFCSSADTVRGKKNNKNNNEPPIFEVDPQTPHPPLQPSEKVMGRMSPSRPVDAARRP